MALEILKRTVWTNKKANQSNMKDVNNLIVDESCNKCCETEDTEHMILECNHYSDKNLGLLPTTFKQGTKTSTHQGASKKSQSRYFGR